MTEKLKRNAHEIIKRLRDAGFKAFVAGGAVRDMVMGIDPLDYDISTDATPQDVSGLFERVIPVGERFGVSIVVYDGEHYEVAQFRIDGEYVDGRRPTTVQPSDEKGDVLRRDFTINAMLYDPFDDRIIDYVGGKQDIKSGLIRTVGEPVERFQEDRLRLLRAVRFAARFDFSIDGATFSAIKQCAEGIHDISRERIGGEIARMFSENNPARALSLLDESRLLEQVMPEVAALKGVEQPPEFHPEGDVFKHTGIMFENYGGGSQTLALGILLHDIGKPATRTVSDRIRFNGHDSVGAEMAVKLLKRLRFSSDTIEKVSSLVKNHMRFIHAREMKQSTFRRFIALDGFDELLELFRLDCIASQGSLDTYDFVKEKCEIHDTDLPEQLLCGDDLIALGYAPGPVFSEILSVVADAQLEGEIATRREAFKLVKKKYPLSADKS